MGILRRVQTPVQKHAWRIEDWCRAVSISRATCYRLMGAGTIRFVMIGKARRITTRPEDFVRALEVEHHVA
jgi:excisionase family DNA binding protein